MVTVGAIMPMLLLSILPEGAPLAAIFRLVFGVQESYTGRTS